MADDDRQRDAALTPEQQALAASHLKLAHFLARPFRRRWPAHADEFESGALFALVTAARSFDPSRGVAFSTHATFRIQGALKDVQRVILPLGYRVSGEAPSVMASPLDEGVGHVLFAAPDAPIGAEIEVIDEAEHWLKKVPESHQDTLCRLIYRGGLNIKEAAKQLGRDKHWGSREHAKAILHLINLSKDDQSCLY